LQPWLVSLLASAACSHEQAPAIPADRPILLWYGTAAADQNRRNLPSGFSAPDVHACAADPTRIYLAELFLQGNVQVNWHWAPIVRGPDAARPTLDQPEFSLAGTLVDASDSREDVLADHPFGNDVVSDVTPDAAFSYLPFSPAVTQRAIHPEVEMDIFPRPRPSATGVEEELGWTPQAADRTVMRGAWVLDCGHPPYGSEIHPPTFLGYARPADARTTIAAAVVVPYRSSLLFNPDPALATDFANTARFSDPSTLPFSDALIFALQRAVNLSLPRLTTHALMTANRFDTLDWAVCAPLPRPAGATLDASWRFTARTGVIVSAAMLDADGCVRFTATMTAAYTPMPLVHADMDWSWGEVSDTASSQLGAPIDVRQTLIQVASTFNPNASQAPALQPQNPPLVDAYMPLHTRPGAAADSPTAIDTAADDQPFPFYGRVHVGWK
jgi:hypothetical protein